jgi:hypothetical protein
LRLRENLAPERPNPSRTGCARRRRTASPLGPPRPHGAFPRSPSSSFLLSFTSPCPPFCAPFPPPPGPARARFTVLPPRAMRPRARVLRGAVLSSRLLIFPPPHHPLTLLRRPLRHRRAAATPAPCHPSSRCSGPRPPARACPAPTRSRRLHQLPIQVHSPPPPDTVALIGSGLRSAVLRPVTLTATRCSWKGDGLAHRVVVSLSAGDSRTSAAFPRSPHPTPPRH